MALAIASSLAKDMAGTPLLRDVSFKVERGERLTLSGRNGSGKTTLLRMLAGETSLDGGELMLSKGARVALHDQRPPRGSGESLRSFVLSGARELTQMEGELRRLEELMAGGDESALGRYSAVQERFEHAGGWRWRDRAMDFLLGLGFAAGDLDRPLESFSGGELTRGALARALAGDPDLLLLDEPTNHLDLRAIEWLESTLQGLDAGVVLVAHDRWFLEAVGTAVLELEGGRSRYFPGPWHAWRREKAARALAGERALGRQAREIERLERFVTRFRAGTRARQARSRARRLEGIERISAEPRSGRSLGFSFAEAERTGRVVLEIEGGTVSAGGRPLLEGCELWIERGERVALVGPNGSGKTTLLETVTGGRDLDRGKLRRGHDVKIGHLSQHGDELGGEGSALEAAQRATGLPRPRAQALLGRFLFSGAEQDKPLAGLSGGERRRLSLAILVATGASFLVLDEPTNHLDVESRESLEAALLEFGGTVLLVSHDRALLDAVATRTVAVEDGRLRSYLGGWADYLAVRSELDPPELEARLGSGPGSKPAVETTPAGRRRQRAASRARQPARDSSVGDLERRIEEAEARLASLEDELADPALWRDPERSAGGADRHAALKGELTDLYGRWERAVEESAPGLGAGPSP